MINLRLSQLPSLSPLLSVLCLMSLCQFNHLFYFALTFCSSYPYTSPSCCCCFGFFVSKIIGFLNMLYSVVEKIDQVRYSVPYGHYIRICPQTLSNKKTHTQIDNKQVPTQRVSEASPFSRCHFLSCHIASLSASLYHSTVVSPFPPSYPRRYAVLHVTLKSGTPIRAVSGLPTAKLSGAMGVTAPWIGQLRAP